MPGTILNVFHLIIYLQDAYYYVHYEDEEIKIERSKLTWMINIRARTSPRQSGFRTLPLIILLHCLPVCSECMHALFSITIIH
jgi:hypothetical protein